MIYLINSSLVYLTAFSTKNKQIITKDERFDCVKMNIELRMVGSSKLLERFDHEQWFFELDEDIDTLGECLEVELVLILIVFIGVFGGH